MPKRGEVWFINLNPSVGDELNKERPALIISSDSIGKLFLKIIVPITEWNPRYSSYPWMVRIKPNKANGLVKLSVADAFQVRSVSMDRLVRKIGNLPESKIRDISAAVAICIDYY